VSGPRTVQLLAFIFLVAFSKSPLAIGDCYRLDTGVDLLLRDAAHAAHAAGSVTCLAANNQPNFEASFIGNIKIHQVNPPTDFTSPISGSGQWIGSIDAPADYDAKTCYQAFISATSGNTIGSNQSAEQCTPDPPPPPGPDPPPDIQDGCNPQCSPIVINFAEGGYVLTGANAPVLFDMTGGGHPTLMGWTAAGADEAFLWLDRNHNHRVTGGAELFGNFTPLQDGHLAKNGFEALAELDANHDGVIDDRDPVWPQLMLWRDLNHNGISEPNEISPLDASDVTAIDLHYHWTGRYDSWGNAFRYESLISIKNPSGRAARKQPVYDIFFRLYAPISCFDFRRQFNL
jgi:hypothetical protein